MAFDPKFWQELKEKNDIVEVIGSYVPLTRKGGQYWACCPFHHEKTPSFAIKQEDGFYHCFGCGVSGDVVKFVQQIESTDFIGAVRILANRAKMEVPESADYDGEKAAEIKRQKDTVLKILLDTARFYLSNLYGGDERAQAHLDYIQRRKISPSVAKKFGLGASLDYRSLPAYLMGKGYKREDLLASGAVSEDRHGKLTDSLAGRLIFPIINSLDEVVAFGGRVMEKTDFAKYKNTRETIVFNKRKNLYNINLLKKLKREEPIREVIMVEGYMDTISLYQAGFKNVVASMGTSLTKEQARLVKRYSDKVLISYDGDFAGQSADLRGLEILKKLRSSPITEQLPVILATARGSEYDKVVGLDTGADDYLAKPFGMMELLARVKALLRRTEQAESEEVYRLGALSVNKTRHEVYAAGQEVALTLKEFDLLCLLLENKGRVLTRDQLLNRIWGYGFDGESRTVDVHIRTLRQKLGECGEYIETVRGVGYKVGGNI